MNIGILTSLKVWNNVKGELSLFICLSSCVLIIGKKSVDVSTTNIGLVFGFSAPKR